MTKHTPAPWRLSKKYATIREGEAPTFMGYFISGSSEYGADILPKLGFIDVFNFPDNMEANANLIKAAPELLEALENAVCMAEECTYTAVHHQDHGCCEQLLYEFIGSFKELITKAKGESND